MDITALVGIKVRWLTSTPLGFRSRSFWEGKTANFVMNFKLPNYTRTLLAIFTSCYEAASENLFPALVHFFFFKKSTITANQSTSWIDVWLKSPSSHLSVPDTGKMRTFRRMKKPSLTTYLWIFCVFPFHFAKSLLPLDTCHRSFNCFNFRYQWMWKSWFQPVWPQCIVHQCRRLLHMSLFERLPRRWSILRRWGQRRCLKSCSRILMSYPFLSHFMFL